MTKKKRPIPDWFNINNYEETENLELCGWLEQFYIRYLLLQAIESGKPISKKDRLYKYMKGTRKGLVQIDTEYSCCRTREQELANINTGSHPLTGFHDKTVVQFDPEHQKRKLNNVETVGADTNKSVEIDQTFKPFSVYLEINPQATDAQLINDFDRWLKEYRVQDTRAKVTIQDDPEKLCREWYKLRLLPYIDLMIRAEALGIHIPLDPLIVSLGASENQLESTLPDWMAEVLDENYLAALNLVVKNQGAYGIDMLSLQYNLPGSDESGASSTSDKKRDTYAADFARSLADLEELHQLLNDDSTTKLQSDRKPIGSGSDRVRTRVK